MDEFMKIKDRIHEIQQQIKALKQEIELVKISGEEKLIIKDYFDQSPENESVIIANVLKQMSNPEINIDMYPDSVLDKISESQSDDLVMVNNSNDDTLEVIENIENEK